MFIFLLLWFRLVFFDLERLIYFGGEVNLCIFNRLVSMINGFVRLVVFYEFFIVCFLMCRVNCNSGCVFGCYFGFFYFVYVGSI